MYFNEDNNYFNYNNISYNDYDIKIDSINYNRNNKLFTLEEGFNKGNMFENIYSKYKNYVYKLKTNNKKDDLLYKIQTYTFALKDLNLYLDVHPTDQSMLAEFNKIKRKLKELTNTYENEYGPLCSFNNDNNDKWSWVSNPWPWDKGGN